MRLTKRVEELERRTGGLKPWHQLIVRAGETVEQVRAAYEADNGPIGDDGVIIVRIGRSPEGIAA